MEALRHLGRQYSFGYHGSMWRKSIIVLGLGFVSGCARSGLEPVEVAAAASTREPMERLAADFQANTGIKVRVSLGPSSTLAKQIEEGGPAALFLSADEGWADYLEKAALVAKR